MRKIYSGGGVMAENFFNRPFLLFQCRLHFVSFMFNYRGRSFHQLHKSTISVPVLYPRRIKASNFDNSHNSFLWPEYFIDFLYERWIPCQAVISKENRIYIRVEFMQSLGMNFVSPFKPAEREFKVYKSCKCSQIACSRVH